MVVDRILAVIWTEIGKYLPTGLITAMMNIHLDVKDKASGFGLNTADYLDPVPAALLLLAYGIGFAVLAMFSTLRRDID
jgi:multisubunit Na+/H+ antiporter MnhC subunit